MRRTDVTIDDPNHGANKAGDPKLKREQADVLG